MVAIGDLKRTKISCSLAVLLITLCVTQTSSEVNICSQELSNVQCRGRCAAAASTKSIPFSDCVQRCCGGRGQGSVLPGDCPLLGLNCSQTPNPVNLSSVAWEGKRLDFHYSSSALATGRDACNMSEYETTPDGLLPLIVSAGVGNGASHFWLLFPGQNNRLLLPDVGSCSNLSVTAVNECEMQELSTIDVVPPNVNLKVTSLTTIENNLLPVVTVTWELQQVQQITDIVYNVTLMESAFLPKNGCETASKVLSQSDQMPSSIEFYSEDFQGESVWLCFYDAIVSVTYKAECGTAIGHASNILKEMQVVIRDAPRLNTSYSFYWNQSTLTYFIDINWTVPLIYGIPNLVKAFLLTSSSFQNGRPVPSFEKLDLTIPATGAIDYQITIEYQPSPYDQYFSLLLGYGIISHPPPSTAESIGPLKLPGNPPSVVVVTRITETMQEGVQVMWMEPEVTNGVILSYTVEVKLLSKGGHTLYADSYIVMEGKSFTFNFKGVADRTMVTRVLMRVAAKNSFALGPFSEYAYLDNITKTGGILQEQPSTSTLPAVVVPVVLVVAAILVVILIIGVLLYMRHRLARPMKLVDRMWQPSDTKPLDPSLYDYSPYFSSKLPPAMVDRWIIPLQMFNSENFYLIGQGNFSTVYYSTIQGPLTTPTQLEYYKNYSEHGVAVKLLNGRSSEREIQSFINEAEVMKHLSAQNCNYVVQLVGLQLEQAPAMIAMEMVPCGSLLDILKNSSIVQEDETFSSDKATSGLTYVNSPPISQLERADTPLSLTLVEFQKERSGSIDSYVQLRKHSLLTDDGYTAPDQKIAIKTSQLLKFAIQVVRGMEYVASCGVVHRDLACRNLLLTGNGIVKISDFGFACTLDGKEYIVEDLPVESKPLRWMSPEAFEQNVYSEASDVWSFGVTLWEIFSQGLFPYPALADHEVLAAVKGANYLDCPEECGFKVYKVMTSCWALSADERPKFANLRGAIEASMYDLYPYMLMEIEEEPSTQSEEA